MKDLPNHIKKLNRRIVRSAVREAQEELSYESPSVSRPVREAKVLQKRKIREERLRRVPIHETEEQRNRKMRHRVPVFDRINNAAPRMAKPTRKKVPRI